MNPITNKVSSPTVDQYFKKHTLFIVSLGNIIEWFDFGLCMFMAPILGTLFFSTHDPVINLLNILLVFALGFVCRPLGGIIFGHFGDTKGRVHVLKFSILLTTTATFLIGLIPEQKIIGNYATIIFVGLRLIHGLAIGSEYSGTIIYLAEAAPAKHRGFFTSFAASGANLGFLLATIVIFSLKSLLNTQQIYAWGWRIPFILLGLIGIVLIYYRFKLTETSVYQHLQRQHNLVKYPFFTAIKYAPLQLLKIFGLTCMSSTFYYVFFGYMPTYLEHYLFFSATKALIFQSCCLISMLCLVPFAGFLGDCFSRKTVLIITIALAIIVLLPCFYLLQLAAPAAILFALVIATLISSMDQGNSLTAVVENCPSNIRYSGIAFSYNLGMAIFGGTAPLIITLCIEHFGLIAPAYYLISMASISLITALTLLGNNQEYRKLN